MKQLLGLHLTPSPPQRVLNSTSAPRFFTSRFLTFTSSPLPALHSSFSPPLRMRYTLLIESRQLFIRRTLHRRQPLEVPPCFFARLALS